MTTSASRLYSLSPARGGEGWGEGDAPQFGSDVASLRCAAPPPNPLPPGRGRGAYLTQLYCVDTKSSCGTSSRGVQPRVLNRPHPPRRRIS